MTTHAYWIALFQHCSGTQIMRQRMPTTVHSDWFEHRVSINCCNSIVRFAKRHGFSLDSVAFVLFTLAHDF